MSEDEQHPVRPAPLVVDYEAPVPVPAGTPGPYTRVVRAMAAAWVLAAMFASTASDRILIPLPKKLVLTLSAVVIYVLLAYVEPRAAIRRACLVMFCCFGFVMWHWN